MSECIDTEIYPWFIFVLSGITCVPGLSSKLKLQNSFWARLAGFLGLFFQFDFETLHAGRKSSIGHASVWKTG